jgi:hypothetical protein
MPAPPVYAHLCGECGKKGSSRQWGDRPEGRDIWTPHVLPFLKYHLDPKNNKLCSKCAAIQRHRTPSKARTDRNYRRVQPPKPLKEIIVQQSRPVRSKAKKLRPGHDHVTIQDENDQVTNIIVNAPPSTNTRSEQQIDLAPAVSDPPKPPTLPIPAEFKDTGEMILMDIGKWYKQYSESTCTFNLTGPLQQCGAKLQFVKIIPVRPPFYFQSSDCALCRKANYAHYVIVVRLVMRGCSRTLIRHIFD